MILIISTVNTSIKQNRFLLESSLNYEPYASLQILLRPNWRIIRFKVLVRKWLYLKSSNWSGLTIKLTLRGMNRLYGLCVFCWRLTLSYEIRKHQTSKRLWKDQMQLAFLSILVFFRGEFGASVHSDTFLFMFRESFGRHLYFVSISFSIFLYCSEHTFRIFSISASV